MTEHKKSNFNIWAILRLRCARCHQGQVFQSVWQINEYCPVCQLKFEREPGYFSGAMFISYTLAVLLSFPTFIILLFSGTSIIWAGLIASGLLIVAAPLLFRYSRVIWLHIDQLISPR